MMTSLFKKMTVALALVGALGAASASPVLAPNVVYLGTLDKTLVFSRDFSGATEAFDDVLSFQATNLGALASVLSIDFVGDLTGFYRFGVGSSFDTVSWIKSSQVNLATAADPITEYLQSFPALQAGETYWLEIAGSMTDGSVITMIIPTEVPEPGSLALVLAAMGAVGVIARRRKGSVTKLGA